MYFYVSLLQFISDYNGEDRFMTRIGVGGLINMDKLKQTHHVLNDIALFHYHAKQQIETVNSRSEEIEFFPLNGFCFSDLLQILIELSFLDCSSKCFRSRCY